jgi:hypothetical protein
VLVKAVELQLPPGAAQAVGGRGGPVWSGGGGGQGGDGGGGRIALYSAQGNSGETLPTAYTQGLSSAVGGTITRSFPLPLDLSQATGITFRVKSSRGGIPLRVGMGEAEPFEHSTELTVAEAGRWQQVSWDLSGLAPSQRDAITRFGFQLLSCATPYELKLDHLAAVH